ncbi:MAG TPA: Type 1 glutamine amidotransferase-like domain-containing protein [Mycobacteriales bacterium]|nr:Type 1 glutamine amidotransferase-like domain-containing protein [Mycobacteriales bacterium]
MAGLVCLQGGGEFSAACHDMDAAILERAPGPVAVVALAARPGAEHDRAAAHGVSHFRRLGADAFVVPDPRAQGARDGDAARALEGVGLVVLPGGSPSRLLSALITTGLDDALRTHVAAGGAVMGASAGAMVLGTWTVLPEEGPSLAPGLGIAAGLVVVPHWRGAREEWLAVIGEGLVLGLPEESGVIVEDGRMTAVGVRDVRLVRERADLSVGHTLQAP